MDGSTWPTALESYGPYFEIMGQWPGPTINLKACSRTQHSASGESQTFPSQVNSTNVNLGQTHPDESTYK